MAHLGNINEIKFTVIIFIGIVLYEIKIRKSILIPTQHRILQKDMSGIFPIFHCNITISTFWNIFENKEIFNTFRNIVEIYRLNVPFLHISIIFSDVSNDDETFFFSTLYF